MQEVIQGPQVQGQVSYYPTSIVGWSSAYIEDLFGLAPYDIIVDALNNEEELLTIPKGFRTPFQFVPNVPSSLDLRGFDKLRMSGAAQFNRNRGESLLRHLEKIYHVKRANVYIIDLREESHGHINNHAITWYYGPLTVQKFKTPQQIMYSETLKVKQVLSIPLVYFHKVIKTPDGMPINKIPTIDFLESAQSEQELVESLGANYIRIPATDHFRPEDESVDNFIHFMEEIKKRPNGQDIWLHFKCRGGRGRTTTFMLMFDMMENPDVSVEDLIERQKILGGTNLGNIPGAPHLWKQRLSIDKVNFIRSLHTYFHASDGYGVLKWSDWTKKHNKESMTANYPIGID